MGATVKTSAKKLCGWGILLISLCSLVALPFLSFNGRIDVMLPENSGLHDIFSFLKEIQVSDKILVTLSQPASTADADVLCSAADRYLAALDQRWAAPMNLGLKQGEVTDDFKRLIRQLPDYTEPHEFEELSAATSYAGISASLKNLIKKLQKPEGMFAASAARADPLDWNGRMVNKIVGQLTSYGYRAVPVQGHLMDPERKNILLVLQTPIQMMDVPGVRGLLGHLEACAKTLPPSVEAKLVCAHLHTLGNETIIRRDITVTSIAVVAVFCILFFGVYRDWRSGYVVLIPFLASLPALALSALFFKSFSALVVGFGSVIAGITIDYAIHAYVVSREVARVEKLKRIRLPVILSALTTLCVFLAFCSSSIPAYRQLGCFASLAILISLLYALVALPHFIPVVRSDSTASPTDAPLKLLFTRRMSWFVLALSVVGFALGLWGLRVLKFDSNVAKLDGTPTSVMDEEARAVKLWGGGESRSAILSVEAQTEEEALRLNDQLYTALRLKGLTAQEVSSLAPLFPSEATRLKRRQAWQAYWTTPRVEAFQKDILNVSTELGFEADGFAPFWPLFEQWRSGIPSANEPIRFLTSVRERFIHASERGTTGVASVRVTTFVPDEPRVLGLAQQVQAEIPSLRIISRMAFSDQLSNAFVREVTGVTKLAGVLILLVTILLIRKPLMVVLALLPAIAGVTWGCAAMAFLGRSLDVSNLIAGIIVLGLCIDYGICMVFAYRDGIAEDVFKAVSLSAVTTVLGAGVLLLAKHPALFSIGVTLVAGVSTGYLCAWLTLRAIHSLQTSKQTALGSLLLLLIPLCVLTGCQTSPFPEPPVFAAQTVPAADVAKRFDTSLAPRFEEQNALVFHHRWMDIAAVGIAAVDRETRSLAVTCMTPLGVKIFEVVYTNGVLSRSFVMPALADKAGPLASTAGEDLMFAYFDLLPPVSAAWHLTKDRLVFKTSDVEGVTEYHYAWGDGKLAEKIRREKKDGLIRRVEYRVYTMTDLGLVPTALRIQNGQRGYSIDVSRCKEEGK